MTAELDHTFATGDGLHNCRPVREFFWRPDLSGTMDGAGGVGGLVSMKWQGSYYLPCIDGNGNIKGWLKLLGNKYELTARYDYDPFGNRITDTGPGLEVSPFGFSTKYRDEETGLLDYGYRIYDPVRGRWLSRDPIGEIVFMGQVGPEFNGTHLRRAAFGATTRPYGFAWNDPANWFDVLGLYEVSENADLSITVKVEHCEVVLIGGHGAKNVINKFVPPQGQGCGARAGQDTCQNGPSQANVPDSLKIPGLPINEERDSADAKKNKQTTAAIETAIGELCKCCPHVNYVQLYVNKMGWKKRSSFLERFTEPSPEQSTKVDCKKWTGRLWDTQ